MFAYLLVFALLIGESKFQVGLALMLLLLLVAQFAALVQVPKDERIQFGKIANLTLPSLKFILLSNPAHLTAQHIPHASDLAIFGLQ